VEPIEADKETAVKKVSTLLRSILCSDIDYAL
jgi:hypothetical protein